VFEDFLENTESFLYEREALLATNAIAARTQEWKQYRNKTIVCKQKKESRWDAKGESPTLGVEDPDT
jgi:hypothetical protein